MPPDPVLFVVHTIGQVLVDADVTPADVRIIMVEVLLRLVRAKMLAPEDLRDLPLRVLQAHLSALTREVPDAASDPLFCATPPRSLPTAGLPDRPNPGGAMSLTVAQLIRQLQTLPPDELVYVHDDWYDFPLALPTAEDIVEASSDVVAGDGLARPRRLILSRASER